MSRKALHACHRPLLWLISYLCPWCISRYINSLRPEWFLHTFYRQYFQIYILQIYFSCFNAILLRLRAKGGIDSFDMGKYLYNDDPFLRGISYSHGLGDLICGIVNDFNILEIFYCNYINFPRHRYQLFYFSIGQSEHPCILLCLPSLESLRWFPIFMQSRCKSFVDFASISGPTRIVTPALSTRRHGQIHKVLMNIFKKQNNTSLWHTRHTKPGNRQSLWCLLFESTILLLCQFRQAVLTQTECQYMESNDGQSSIKVAMIWNHTKLGDVL